MMTQDDQITRHSRYSVTSKAKQPPSFGSIIKELKALSKSTEVVSKEQLRGLIVNADKTAYNPNAADDLVRFLKNHRVIICHPEMGANFYMFDEGRAATIAHHIRTCTQPSPIGRTLEQQYRSIMKRYEESPKKGDSSASTTHVHHKQKTSPFVTSVLVAAETLSELIPMRYAPADVSVLTTIRLKRVLFFEAWERQLWCVLRDDANRPGTDVVYPTVMDRFESEYSAMGEAYFKCSKQQFMNMITRLLHAGILRQDGLHDGDTSAFTFHPDVYHIEPIERRIDVRTSDVYRAIVSEVQGVDALDGTHDFQRFIPERINRSTVQKKLSYHPHRQPAEGWGIIWNHPSHGWLVSVPGFEMVRLLPLEDQEAPPSDEIADESLDLPLDAHELEAPNELSVECVLPHEAASDKPLTVSEVSEVDQERTSILDHLEHWAEELDVSDWPELLVGRLGGIVTSLYQTWQDEAARRKESKRIALQEELEHIHTQREELERQDAALQAQAAALHAQAAALSAHPSEM